MANDVELLLPKLVADSGSTRLSARPDSLDGKVVGFIWNSKPNADALFDEFIAQVGADHALRDVKRFRKPSAAVAASEEILDGVQSTCDVAVVAIGD